MGQYGYDVFVQQENLHCNLIIIHFKLVSHCLYLKEKWEVLYSYTGLCFCPNHPDYTSN